MGVAEVEWLRVLHASARVAPSPCRILQHDRIIPVALDIGVAAQIAPRTNVLAPRVDAPILTRPEAEMADLGIFGIEIA